MPKAAESPLPAAAPWVVLGAGAWGTAVSMAAAVGGPVLLWARDAAQAEALARTRENQRYLPGVPLPPGVEVTSDLDAALGALVEASVAIVATPMAGLRPTLQRLPPAAACAWLCKGFERDTGLLGHEVVAAVRPDLRWAVLSGPSFAREVAQGQPTALVAASPDALLAARLQARLHGPALRVYTSADPIGVEVGGAVKNVLAIATGIADGLQLGLNARAALVTRGLAEMTRLGLALGAQADTFMGLSGLGDLVLTATGDLSRNRQVGLGLAAGRSLAEVLAGLGHVAEGVATAATVCQRARGLGVAMPITEAVVAVLEGRATPAAALRLLMGRLPQAEAF